MECVPATTAVQQMAPLLAPSNSHFLMLTDFVGQEIWQGIVGWLASAPQCLGPQPGRPEGWR